MKNVLHRLTVVSVSAILALSAQIGTAAEPAKNLDELLNLIEQSRLQESQTQRDRLQEFRQEKAEQAQLLKEARAERDRQEERSSKLEKEFEDNDQEIADAQQRLKERMGDLNELFGHMTTAAADARSNFKTSIISVHYPERIAFLDQLVKKTSEGSELPKIEEIERLWFELQREMTQQGKVVRFPTTVVKPDGNPVEKDVVRVGNFNMVTADGKYLDWSWDGENGTLSILPRQPSGYYLEQARKLASAEEGMTQVGLDPTGPSGGSYLSALINSPTLSERWHQGGYVGYIITAVGVFALIIAVWRLIALSVIGAKVRSQLKSDKANENNPLGRVLKVHEQNPEVDTETLELKLNEAVLKELPSLENSLNLLKIIAAVAPLLGLLGTVTGMIITFQAITIFGAGDPKAMAGGISSALVTTVLGLTVAIPTVLLHTFVSGRSKRIVHVLEEQTAGIVAEHKEAKQ